MSIEAPPAPQKINLRRPDVMAAVQAQVLSHYRSDLVERIRSSGCVLSAGDLPIKLAKQFGFCYGVERAIDLAYAARKVFPQQPIYILGEIIHNPEVNDQIRAMGIKFLSGKEKDADIDDLKKGDIVIIPAFGTEVSMRQQLEAKGCQFVDTDRKSTRLNSSHLGISYAVFCFEKIIATRKATHTTLSPLVCRQRLSRRQDT